MPLMNLFEPLFLLCVLVTVVILVTAGLAAVRGQGARAVTRLKQLAIGAAIYLAVVWTVAAATPRKVYRVGDVQCFDDWCIAVTGASERAPGSVTVELRLSSRAKRVPMGEKGTVVYLEDSLGRRFDPQPEQGMVPLDTLLQPGQSVDAPRTFAVPTGAQGLGPVYTHEGGFPIGDFIITENDRVHGPPIVRFDSAGVR